MRSIVKLLVAGSVVLAPATAFAATTATTITATASVVSSCTVTAAPLAFATYSGAAVPGSTTISPNCSNGTAYWISIDQGAGSGASTTTRKMTGSSGTLDYGIYTTAAYTTPWGVTQGTDTVAGTGNGSTQTVNVYGRIIAGQSSPVGTGYTDTVNVTLNF